MRKTILLVLLNIVSASVAEAQGNDAEAEVLAAHKAWFETFDRGDVESIARMETDDFVLVNFDRIVEKRVQLENIRTGFGGGFEQTRVVGVHSFSEIGDTAIITGTQYSSTQAGGTSIIFSEVWVRQEGRWRIRLAHFSPAERGQ